MANKLYEQLQNQPKQCEINPQLQQVIKIIRQSGMTPKDLFYSKAKEMGIDPESILSKLR